MIFVRTDFLTAEDTISLSIQVHQNGSARPMQSRRIHHRIEQSSLSSNLSRLFCTSRSAAKMRMRCNQSDNATARISDTRKYEQNVPLLQCSPFPIIPLPSLTCAPARPTTSLHQSTYQPNRPSNYSAISSFAISLLHLSPVILQAYLYPPIQRLAVYSSRSSSTARR